MFDYLAAAAVQVVKNATTPLPTKVEGASLTTYAVWALSVLVLPITLVALGVWPKILGLRNSAADKFMGKTLSRMDDLEEKWREERADCDRRIKGYEAKLEAFQRMFLQHQLALIRFLPGAGIELQNSINKLIEIASRPVEYFMVPGKDEDEEDGE